MSRGQNNIGTITSVPDKIKYLHNNISAYIRFQYKCNNICVQKYMNKMKYDEINE